MLVSRIADQLQVPHRQQEAPAVLPHQPGPTSKPLERRTMQFEDNEVYRVKAVAQALDVSPATIYRAIESGSLDAYKLGTGKGTLRVRGAAINDYLRRCGSANAALPNKDNLTDAAAVSVLDGAA